MLPGFSEVPGLCFSFLRQAFAANDEARLMSDISLTMKKRSCRYQHHTQSPESRGACFHQPDHIMSYIMGNPPFVGKKEQTKEQKAELFATFGTAAKSVGNLDYVTAWYRKALSLIHNTSIHCAFVSTNSITQGEQVAPLWNNLLTDNIHIDFAYRTFRWDSEANCKAHVHCVIIGFSCIKNTSPIIYDENGTPHNANNISPYLVDAPSVVIESRTVSICDALTMQYGSMPIDDGHLILDKNDVDTLLVESKDNIKFIREYAGGAELIKKRPRWCLWLLGASPTELLKSSFIMERIRQTKAFRLSSNRPQTLALADSPSLFGEIRQPHTQMLVIPKVSSETRRYIPICFIEPTTIINGSALIIADAGLYHLGVLISNVHMSWMRTVCGRMKSDYQYSANVVYNNFPWPTPTNEQKSAIEQTAQAILDARALYPDCSLADLYDPLTMPPELRKAHQQNDIAVMKAYGLSVKDTSEADCVAFLMKRYQELTKE